MNVEFKRVVNGMFEVYKDGLKANYEIVNGCLGSSGFGGNMYGIVNLQTGNTAWQGSLQKCKKILIRTLTK